MFVFSQQISHCDNTKRVPWMSLENVFGFHMNCLSNWMGVGVVLRNRQMQNKNRKVWWFETGMKAGLASLLTSKPSPGSGSERLNHDVISPVKVVLIPQVGRVRSICWGLWPSALFGRRSTTHHHARFGIDTSAGLISLIQRDLGHTSSHILEFLA